MNIIKLVNFDRYTLAVFYTSSDCYQYSIIDLHGLVHEIEDIFYTIEAAETEGIMAIA